MRSTEYKNKINYTIFTAAATNIKFKIQKKVNTFLELVHGEQVTFSLLTYLLQGMVRIIFGKAQNVQLTHFSILNRSFQPTCYYFPVCTMFLQFDPYKIKQIYIV